MYSFGAGWFYKNIRSTIYVVDTCTLKATKIQLTHGLDRIEALGPNAIVIGADDQGTLHFSGMLPSAPRRVRLLPKLTWGENQIPVAFPDGPLRMTSLRFSGQSMGKNLKEVACAVF